METRKAPIIPTEMEELRQQFENWRSTHSRPSRIPETLWASAVESAKQHGVYRTAQALRLDYTRLKARVGNQTTGATTKSSPTFVELFSPTASSLPECIVELENARGKKMRIHLRGLAVPDVALWSRIFWGSRA